MPSLPLPGRSRGEEESAVPTRGRSITLLDYRVIPTNPTGSCHLKILEGLAESFDFTVVAAEFDNQSGVPWIRVRVPMRPLALLFVAFHVTVPFRLAAANRPRSGIRQSIESNYLGADICYAHFCHRAFLRKQWPAGQGTLVRSAVRWLDHWLRAKLEPAAYRRATVVVAPSQGLAAELKKEYPFIASKLRVIFNPIECSRFVKPEGFDSTAFRASLDLSSGDVVLMFAALGHFERKGLGLLLDTLASLDSRSVRLLVVGGSEDLVSIYERRSRELGVSETVRFVGTQPDIRPFLWSSDGFILASRYEACPLVALEAAAAALPVLVTPLHGVEEFIVDGVNGFVFNPTVSACLHAVQRFTSLGQPERLAVGERARASVLQYDMPTFLDAWRLLYEELL